MVQEYLSHLTELSIDVCTNEGRRLTLMLLTSCPKLRTVTTPRLKASEMRVLSPQGWVCKGLRRLSVYFELDEEEDEDEGEYDDEEVDKDVEEEEEEIEMTSKLHEASRMDKEENNRFVLEQLSVLTELEVLLLNSDRRYSPRYNKESMEHGLSVFLGGGLEVLEGLKYLRGVALPDHQPWTQAELDWVKEHWPRLTDLAGINEYNLKAEEGLEEEVKKRGLQSLRYAEDFHDLYPSNLVSMYKLGC
ncbi:hypothetical protein BGX29_006369 [Mortierella sp. GBA35]|nr:hypothetical protein BGX29_006369 [Mortierella sp. GBA35]